MDDANAETLRGESDGLFASARTGELAPAVFAARLEALHTRFLGEKAYTPEMIERRRSASTAYDRLWSAEDLDNHHHLEQLAETLGVDLTGLP